MDRELDIGIRRKRTIRRIVTALIVLGTAAGLLVGARSWLRPSIRRDDVRFGIVQRGDMEETIRASGTVVPAFERVLTSPVEARVVRVLRSAGAVLQPGDPILELDTSATRLELEKLEERLAQNENDREQRRLELDGSLADLEARMETQRLDMEIARYRLTQNSQLRGDGLISEALFKESEVAVEKARIQLGQLEDGVVAARGSNEVQLARLELDARILRREQDDTRRQLELATTRTEQPGVLTWVVEEPGTLLGRGDLIARIADLDSFRVEATVSDAYASRLDVGQQVRVVIGDEEMPAVLSTILPTIEDGALRFTVDLEQASDTRLRHNLRVDVLVVTGFRGDVLQIPRGPYIRGGGEGHQVFVVRGDLAVRTDVRVGIAGHEYLELIEGLNEGDEVIVSDMRNKIHARRIRVK